MITIKIIPDIFKTEGRKELIAPYPEGKELYLSAFIDEEIYRQADIKDVTPRDFIESFDVWYEGRVIKPEELGLTRIEDCSEIVFFLRPGRGGWQALIGAVITILGIIIPGAEFLIPYGLGMLISGAAQLLFTPEAPNFTTAARNRNYGWEGVETEYATIGSMVPIPYGRIVTGGKCIHQRLYAVSDDNQRLDILLLIGEGQIRGIRKEEDTGILPAMRAMTIAFHDNDPSKDTITDSASGFVNAGFVAGDKIVVHGSDYNNHTFTIDTVTAGTITLSEEDELTDESAGNNVTILCNSQNPWIKLDGKFISGMPDAFWDYLIGTLDQSAISGFALLSTNYNVDHRITENMIPDDTWFTITNAGGGNDFDSVEFNFYFPKGLFIIDDRGVVPLSRRIFIEKKEEPSGSWESCGYWQKVGALTGPFYWTIRIDDLGCKPYSFRMRCYYKENRFGYTDEKLYGDRIDLLHYNRLTKEDLRYPGCVLVAIGAVASEQLSSVQPNIQVKLDGRLLKYYTTSWQEETWDTGGGDDGDIGRNPAWQVHDLIYNGIYGLGPYFDDALKVSAKFKELADYADQMIDDGQGGTEKRFLSDILIDGIVDPWDMLKHLLRSCHSFPVVAGAQIYPVVEKERSPVMTFGMDNIAVEEGGDTTFTESWRMLEDTFNLVEVQYFDKDKDFVREVIHYPDDDSLIPQGEKIRKFTAIFYNVCRRSQAARLAKYHWLMTQYVKKFIQFSTNEEAIALQPGDVFYFSHDIPQFDYSGKIFRVRSEDNTIELDNSWDSVDTGSHSYKLLIRDLTDDTIETKDVTVITTENKRHLVTFSGSYSFTPESGDPYILIEDTTVPIKYVCVELSRDEQMRRTISAQEYIPEIYDYTTDIEPIDYSDLPNPHDPPPAPTDLTLMEMPDKIGFYVNAVAPIGHLFYDHCRIYLSEDELDWEEIGRVKEVINYPVTPVVAGLTYHIKVISFNRHGVPCVNPPTASITVEGLVLPPVVRGLEIFGQGHDTDFIGKDCKIRWNLASPLHGLGSKGLGKEGLGLGETPPYIKDTKVSIYLNGIEKRTEFVPFPGNTYTYTLEKNIEDMGDPQRSFEFRLWYRDNYNRLSPEHASLNVTNPAPSLAGQTPVVSDIPYGFRIEWDPPPHHDVDKYYVYCDENNPPTTIRARVSAYETLVNIVNLDPNTTYYVKVVPGDPYGMGTASNIVQKSVPLPGVVVPVDPDDPTELGELKGIENILEFDDCDDHTKWTAEIGGIVLATDGEALKEGTGSLKVGIDKYTCVAENLWYTVPNPPWPPMVPTAYMIGSITDNRYCTQGFKVSSSCSLKRVGIPLWYAYGYEPPSGCKVMIYSDDGYGNPYNKLGEATFAGITYQQCYRWADFSAPISLTGSVQYHMVFCRVDEGIGCPYFSRKGEDKYGDAQYDYFQHGNSLSSLTEETDADALFRLFKDEATANNHFKITSLSSKDISTYPSLEYWIKSNKTGASWLQASMGESGLGEQTNYPNIATTWTPIAWDISGIAAGNRDAIAFFGFKVVDADPLPNPSVQDHGKIWLWTDYIRAAKDKKIKFKFADEIVTVYPQFIERENPSSADWDKNDLTLDGNWHDLDCSSVVPEGTRFIYFKVQIEDDAAESMLIVRKKGYTSFASSVIMNTQVADVSMYKYFLVACDSNRKVEYFGSNLTWTTVSLTIHGWVM